MKIVVKKPGLEMESIVSELDLSYSNRYTGAYIPDAYERLILDAIRGDQQHFVRRCARGRRAAACSGGARQQAARRAIGPNPGLRSFGCSQTVGLVS